MVVAPETGPVADVVFVVEGTANMGAYLGELRQNYLIPTLECFNGGPAEDRDCGSELTSTLYALIVFMAADTAPEPAVTCAAAPTTSISKFLSWLDKVPFLGGAAEGCSHVAEGLGTALQAFDDFQAIREPHLTTQKHCILVCNSPPYPLACQESMNYAGLVAEQLANVMGERGINLSIISPRKMPSLLKLYDKAGGDLQLAQNKNYTKDRRHLVLLKGYQLQERPLSPTSAEYKDKLQGTAAPQLGAPLQPDKPLLSTNTLTPAGSPGSSNLMQSQTKGPVSSPQIGKKRPASGSPPTQPPFKQPVGMGQGNMMNQMGPVSQQQPPPQNHGIMGGPPQQQQQQQQQQIGSVQAQMPPGPQNIPSSLSNMGGPMQNQQVRAPLLPPPGAPISRPGPHMTSQPAPSFMNQPNPPNVTISKGPPLSIITAQPMETNMGRPTRDQGPTNSGMGPRMIWNPPGGAGPVGPGLPTPNQNVGQPTQAMSQLVMRLQQPTRGNAGMMGGPRPGDLMGAARPPNVTAGTPGPPPNAPQGMVGVMQPPNFGQTGPTGLNQPQSMQPNVNQGAAKLNMGHPVMAANTQSALQSQLGAQGGAPLQHMNVATSMAGNQPPNVGMTTQAQVGLTSSGPPQPNVNVTGGLGGLPQNAMQGTSMGNLGGQGPGVQGQQVTQPQPGQVQQPQGNPQAQGPVQRERRVVWQGVVEWQEKPKMPNDGKINRQVPCQVSSTVNTIGDTEVNADKWPKKLIMQLIPKLLMQHFGSNFLKMARTVVFHFSHNVETAEALASLNKVMSTGFVGCVHFSQQQNVNCDIRILMLVYSTDKHTYVGFIPNDQVGFVTAIRNVITKKQQSVKQQQQAVLHQQMFGPMGGGGGSQQMGQINPGLGSGMSLSIGGPPQSIGGSGPPAMGMGGVPNVPSDRVGVGNIPVSVAGTVGSTSSSGVPIGGGAVTSQQLGMVNHPNPGAIPSGPPGGPPNAPPPQVGGGAGAAGGGAGGPSGVPTTGGGSGQGPPNTQLAALEQQLAAERHQNQLKIQQLQQSLEAAHQKEVQLKAAQEHQKQQQAAAVLRQPGDLLLLQQLQQQQQQRMLHVGGNTSSTNNPQLRHLLQIRHQQQQALMQQNQGQRPPMAPGPMGQPGIGSVGTGQPQAQNQGAGLFTEDIL